MEDELEIEDFKRGNLNVFKKDENNEIEISITNIGKPSSYLFLNQQQATELINFLRKQIL